MKVFLIILAVLLIVFAVILSFSVEFSIVFDNGWSTKVRILFIEKDIKLSKLLSFILFPEKAAQNASDEQKKKKKGKEAQPKPKKEKEEKAFEYDNTKTAQEEKKPNYIQKILNEDGVVGILLFISNLLQTAASAVTTLIKGLHIYSLYVKMIIGGGDAADIAEKYGSLCGIYYPVKGMILNSMKVDRFDDYIQPDFIAPRSEYEFQITASINVALLLRVLFSAGKVFVINMIKNK